MQAILKVSHLTKKYGTRTAVNQLSFEVYAGQILGLLGPNGAGKTTTMRMLMGLSRPTSGKIEIFGRDLNSNLQSIHAQIGVVFEKPNLFENLSAYQNLAIYAKLYGQPLSQIQPLLERMNLGDRSGDPVKTFSKGMKQRILILRALVHHPKLLFLDEPASGLDPVSARIIWDYLKEQTSQGVTVILTSHDMEEVDQLCDRIGFINHGQLIRLAETEQLKSEFGEAKLRVTRRGPHQEIITEILEPSPVNFQQIQKWYAEGQIISVHSMEASLSEIFQKLSRIRYEE